MGPTKALRLAAVAVAGGALLAACGASAGSNATAACRLVRSSIALWQRANAASGATRSALASQAEVLLERAEPLANIAAGANSGYQPLAATLGEVGRVSEDHLVRALQQECAHPNAASGPLLPSS